MRTRSWPKNYLNIHVTNPQICNLCRSTNEGIIREQLIEQVPADHDKQKHKQQIALAET